MSTNIALSRLIRQGESETIEFKESFGRAAIETLCGFANTNGGTLLLGVSDHGTIEGIQVGRNLSKEIANQIAQATGLHPSIQVTRTDGKTVVVIRVEKSKTRPVTFRGRAYKRVANTTRQMSAEELTRVILDSVGSTWDELPEPRANLSDIDPSKIKAFIRLVNEGGRRPIPDKTPTTHLLEKLDFIQKGRLTRAAVLLFGKRPQRFYLQAMIKAGRFKSETLIVDDREIEGTLFDQVEGAISYFRERLETRFEMTGQPQRKVVWEYPLEALREAVVNAVCHRDYISNGHTQIRIYDNRILIWNPGDLPENLPLEKLKGQHPSVPRNRLIAKAFFYTGLIEQWGSGIEKMVRGALEHGLPEPTFEEEMGFKVTFHKSASVSPAQGSSKSRKERVLSYITQHGSITTREFVQLTGKSKETARVELSQMVKEGSIAKEGHGRSVRYTLGRKKRVGD